MSQLNFTPQAPNAGALLPDATQAESLAQAATQVERTSARQPAIEVTPLPAARRAELQKAFDDVYIVGPEIVAKLGITPAALSAAVREGRFPQPHVVTANRVHLWVRSETQDYMVKWFQRLYRMTVAPSAL